MHDRMDPCVQSQHLPMMCPQVSRKYQVALASTLNPDGAPGSEKYDSVSPGPHSATLDCQAGSLQESNLTIVTHRLLHSSHRNFPELSERPLSWTSMTM